MPQVSLYVAVITAAAAVLGAAVSPLSTAYQNSRQAVRDRAERHDTAVRRACVGLLRTARGTRVHAANTAAYHGVEMGSRLERMRELAGEAASQADEVVLLVPAGVADSATTLASAVRRLATATQDNVRFDASIRDPDFSELDGCIEDFSARVVELVRNGGS
jgi:hypothetical protein